MGCKENLKMKTLVYSITYQKIYESKNVLEFFEYKNYDLPKDTETMKNRIIYNFNKFRGNYLIFFLIFSLISIAIFGFLPLLLISLIWIVCFLVDKKCGSVIEIYNIRLRKSYILLISLILTSFTIFYLILKSKSFGFFLAFYLLLIFLHMNVYKIE